MIAIIIAIIAFLFILSYFNISNTILRNMVLVFLLFWCSTLTLSTFNPFNLFNVSYSTYFLLLLFVISFTVGVLSYKSIAIQKVNNTPNFGFLIDKIITNKLFVLFIILLDAVLLYLYVKEQSILAMYSVAEMRVNIDELLYEGNSFLGLTRNMIIIPITPIITFLGTYLLMYNRKHIFPLALVMFFVGVSALLGGSRGGILRIAIYCIFMIICKEVFANGGKKNKSMFPIIVKFIPILIAVLIVMSNMTAQREYDMHGFSWKGVVLGAESLSKHFITYCTGPFRALDYSFQNEYLERVGGYKFGGCTLGFIDGMISLVLNTIGINYRPAYRELATLLQENWILIGGGESFNFAYTALIFPYMDFGLFGIILIPFIFGRIVAIISNRFVKTKNPMLLIVLGYLFTVMIDTIFTWRLYRHQAFITFMYIFLLYIWYKKKYLRKNSIYSVF